MASEVKELPVRSRAYVLGLISVILYGAVMAVFANFGPCWQPFFTMSGAVRIEETYDALPFLYFVPLVATLLAAAVNRKDNPFLNKKELLIVIAMIWIPIWIPTYWGILVNYSIAYRAREAPYWFDFYQRFAQDTMHLFGPTPWDDAAKWDAFLYGGAVNWAEWATPTLFFIAWTVPFYLMGVFFAAIIRRQFVEVENMPFPLVTGLTRLLDMSYERENGRPEIFKNKWLWIGIVLSIVSTAPAWSMSVIPSLIPLRPWTTPGNPGLPRAGMVWAWDLIPLGILPWVPIVINLDLPMIGGALFIPSTTLLSYVVFSFIIFWILPPIWTSVGLWDPMEPGETMSMIYGYIAEGLGPINQANWRAIWGGNYAWFGDGAMVALVFLPFFVTYRKDLGQRLKAIFTPNPEIEKNEALPYRYLWAGFILCWLVNGVVFWYGSAGVANYLWILFSIMMGSFIWWPLFTAKVAGEFGAVGVVRCDNPGHYIQGTFSYWWVAPGSPLELPQAERFVAIRGNLSYSWVARGNPLAGTLEMFKAAREVKLHSKHILLAGILSVVVCCVVAAPVFLTTQVMWGAKNLEPWMGQETVHTGPMRYPFYIAREVPVYKAGIPPVTTQWGAVAIGAIQTIILTILRAKLPWFPISPAGAAIAWFFQPWGMLFPAIIAYILRTIVIRVGGTRMYENMLIPLATGLIAGWTIMTVVSGLSLVGNFVASQGIIPV